jgi:hypothetical protein
MELTPWLEVEVMCLMPETVLSFCSRGVVMPSSTSSAAAPRHSTRTVTKSRLKLGKNWTLSLDKAKKPGQHQDQHEQVGRHRMVDEGAQEVGAFHGVKTLEGG